MDNLSDAQLIAATLAGNRAAFGVLVERYQAMVLQVTWRTIGHHDLTRDLVQETFLQAFLSLSQLRDHSRFRGWLHGIALNVCRDFMRRQRSNPLSFESLAGGVYIADDMPSPETLAEQIELRQTVQRALQSLTEANRAAVLLFYYEGFNTREIADMLEISVSAVKVRLHKARQQLKAYLEAVLPIVEQVRGVNDMIPVTIADVRHEISTNSDGSQYHQYQVILFDEQNRRALVIWIGEIEALVIARGIMRDTAGINRPLTQQLIASLLKATDAAVEAVEISKLENNIYYATIRMKTANGTVREIDARPSDALGIAAWNNIPIFAAESVLQEQGIAVSEGKKAHRRGVEDWIKNMYQPAPVFAPEGLSQEQLEEFKKNQEAETRRIQRENAQKAIEAVFE